MSHTRVDGFVNVWDCTYGCAFWREGDMVGCAYFIDLVWMGGWLWVYIRDIIYYPTLDYNHEII